MTTLEKIKSKVTRIDIDELIERLKIELKIPAETETENETENEENASSNVDSEKLLEYALYDTLLIILDVTHLKKVNDTLYSIWVNMIKDYWYLNKYDELVKSSETTGESESDTTGDVKSIAQGNEKIEFYEKGSTVEINGTRYHAGTINFDTNLLREKYKSDLYRHRVMRW